MKSRVVSNSVFSFVMIGAILISLFSFSDAFADVTILDREKISSLNSTTFDGSSLGIESGNLFGYHIANIDDLDGDGVNDLAVSQYTDNFPNVFSKTNSGSLSILFMNANGTVKNVNKILHDNSTSGLGTTCIDDYGTQVDASNAGFESLAYLGNLINGNPTLAVGAGFDNITGTNSGAIYILELTSGGIVNSCTRITDNENGFTPAADKYIIGGSGELGFILLSTDLDNNGTLELVATATAESDDKNDIWSLFLRDNSGGGNVVSDFQYVNATAFGVNTWLDSGSTIDGGKKIVIGSQGVNTSGAVFIINFNSDGTLNHTPTQINGSSLGQGISGNQDDFGSGATVIGDLDGDGILDIMVGNEAGDDDDSGHGTANSGEAYILFMNSNDTVKGSQKISNESEFTRTGETPFSASDLFGSGMVVWIDSSGQTVIAMGATQDDTGGGNSGVMYLFYIEKIVITKNGGGCDDCTPPTLGVNKYGIQMVEGGFNYNGNIVDVKHFYTEFPLINAIIGKLNSVQVKIYENGGIVNNKWVQFGLGVKEVRSPVNDSEVIVLVNLHHNGTAVESIDIVDKENLIENDSVFATVYPIKCKILSNNENCILVSLVYSYREAPRYNIMVVNTVDDKRNSWNFYFNDGIKVIGKSLNEPPTSKQFFKNGSQDKDVWYTLTRTDKINDIWTDQNGIEYQNNNSAFDRITPYESWSCNDPPLDQINVPTRTNCNFRALTTIWG